MMSASIVVVSLSGMLGISAPQPSWHTDYAAAVAKAAEQQRPVAVFVTGGSDPAHVVPGGVLSAETLDVLSKGYVPVLVNTTTEEGKKLASAFNLSEGLVISDKTGKLQALRHSGQVPAADLSKYLATYAAPSGPVTTTVSTGTAPAAAQPVATVAPVAISPVVQPAFGPTAVGGSCPNCRR